jgi:hypothetical protein
MTTMTADDFRQMALSFAGAEEASHMGAPDFRVGGRIFATLASESQGYGNLRLSPAAQHALIVQFPDLFLPIHGGWGRMGMTHIRLSQATPELLRMALDIAWRWRCQKNAASGRRKRR